MRMMPILLLALMVGCGAPAEAPEGADAPESGAADAAQKWREAAAKLAANRGAPAKTSGRGFQSPLPGDVVPDFGHVLIVDLSSRANFVMRQVSLGATDLPAEEAMNRLAAQFVAAGFTLGEASEHRGAKMVGLWQGGGEARGMVVVSEGGTYINIIANDTDESKHAENGWISVLAMTIYTPL